MYGAPSITHVILSQDQFNCHQINPTIWRHIEMYCEDLAYIWEGGRGGGVPILTKYIYSKGLRIKAN